jgi:hypothetical protein
MGATLEHKDILVKKDPEGRGCPLITMSKSFSDLGIQYSIIINAGVPPRVHALPIAQDTFLEKISLKHYRLLDLLEHII